jgi:CheY-like chemotaxis protein
MAADAGPCYNDGGENHFRMAYQTIFMSEAVPHGKPRLRILIAEDHTPTRLAMIKLIREAGADVTAARDGEEALGYLLTQKFDVLLTDLRMPKLDGFELLTQAENLPSTHRPDRVIAISGEYEAGALHGRAAVQFLPKPFNLDSLLNMLGGKPN